jgi:hypothetical protein
MATRYPPHENFRRVVRWDSPSHVCDLGVPKENAEAMHAAIAEWSRLNVESDALKEVNA